MDRLADLVAQKLSAPTSRRGFLGHLGKLALAGGAVAAGLGAGTAFAANCCPNFGNGCIAPPGATCTTANNPVCCLSGGYYWSYWPCQGCNTNSPPQCCTGSTSCGGPLLTCGFAPVHR